MESMEALQAELERLRKVEEKLNDLRKRKNEAKKKYNKKRLATDEEFRKKTYAYSNSLKSARYWSDEAYREEYKRKERERNQKKKSCNRSTPVSNVDTNDEQQGPSDVVRET
jgi:hypothetical protein